jgi:hypothetical protein
MEGRSMTVMCATCTGVEGTGIRWQGDTCAPAPTNMTTKPYPFVDGGRLRLFVFSLA